ncbi:MAG: ATP-dependent 6-phosphofructokinase [Actinomycetia bacterium]|nr:ATP-dependent 6-phosphofructokinase [Actinomycetes bacterium]
MAQSIGILTAGGDSPGLNAAIRAIGKSAIRSHGWSVIGFRDGFRGLMQNRSIRLDSDALSGILTQGGTVLGTGRDKVHRMDVGGEIMDMTGVMKETFGAHNLSALVCLGGGGTQKNALRLHEAGMPVITLPKTIDNDVYGTDRSFGFDTALEIATEAVDRLHSTAHSHHRIIVVEIMGHNAGWLTLGSGLGGGADVILIPEIPYSIDEVASAIIERRSSGSTFSIVAVAEGAIDVDLAGQLAELRAQIDGATGSERSSLRRRFKALFANRRNTVELARQLEELTGLESRVTILGHVQRGGTPSPADRILATTLGVSATDSIAAELFGVMIASRGDGAESIPLKKVAGRRKMVPVDHPWIVSARSLDVCFGDTP